MIAVFVELNLWQVSSEYHTFPEINSNDLIHKGVLDRGGKRERQRYETIIIFFLQYAIILHVTEIALWVDTIKKTGNSLHVYFF